MLGNSVGKSLTSAVRSFKPDGEVSMEADMRRTTVASPVPRPFALPRGYVILGAALLSWGLFALVWVSMSQLFQFVMSAF